MTTEPTSVPRVAYKVPEAAEALALSQALVWRLVKSGQLRSYKVGSSRFVPVTALSEFVEARLAEQPASDCCGLHPGSPSINRRRVEAPDALHEHRTSPTLKAGEGAHTPRGTPGLARGHNP